MNISQRLGKTIRAHRIRLGLSQEALGVAVGITFQQIQKYEKGVNTVNVTRLMEIASALSVGGAALLAIAIGDVEKAPDFSERATLEMMKRFHELAKPEQEAIIAFMKALSAGRNSNKERK